MDLVKKSLSKVLSISEVFLWTDFHITLAWIRAENKEFQTFVESRVQEIRKLTDSRGWYYHRTIIRTGITCKKIPLQKSIEFGMALK